MRYFASMLVLAGVLGSLVPVEADAQRRPVRFHGIGPRVGFSLDPDHFVFGGHADFGDPFPYFTLLLPVIEIGVGDNRTTTSLGTDLLFRFSNSWGSWTPYMGGELAFVIQSFDNPGKDRSSDIGLSGIFGIEKGVGSDNRFATEFKLAFEDAPSFKFTAIWTFGH